LEEREQPDEKLDGEPDEELAQDVSLYLVDNVKKMMTRKRHGKCDPPRVKT
jgi:hypothetical protein